MELERMTLTSASGSKLNLDALYQIMPSCFTEVRDDKTGKISHKINFTTLRELLGDNAYEGADEEYGFSWVGKNAARREAASSINKTLRPCPEESVDWDSTENLYIEGDNLEVLKLLQKSYLGKIKMIYIDPPYNTGNDFVYRDDFAMSADDYDLQAGNVDELGNRFRKNADGNARFHSDWCSMIYERLLVARALLSDDGVIFISIDDNEVRNLRNICDEVFGEENQVAEIPWQSRASIQNDTDFSINHEYICVYAKRRRLENRRLKESNMTEWYKKDSFVCRPLPLDKSKFDNPDNDPRGLWKADPFDAPNIRPNLTYVITNPLTGEQFLPPHGRHWRTESAQFQKALNDNRIVFGKDGKGRPQLKVFYEEKKEFGSIDNSWFSADRIGTTTNGTKEVMSLFDGYKYFDMPKPISMLRKIIELANVKSDDIILDFFSGSATTAHAVMQLNAEDGGNRKFIMVQLPEVTDEKSEARKAGYNTICEIGKERIRRAGKKIKEEAGEKAANLDTGFRVFKCEDSFMNDVYFAPSELKQEDLFSQIKNIKDGTSDLSLLFGCMLDWGVQLSLPLSHFTVAGKTIHNVNDGDLVACFAEDINEDVISAIAELSPLRVVFRDSCFSESALKMNLFELFKQKCGWSEEQVRDKVRVI